MTTIIQDRSRLRTRRGTFGSMREIIRHFTLNWFAVTMGTGILAVSLGQFSQMPILFTIGAALWCLNILLFCAFACTYTARWILYPEEAGRVFGHPILSMFFGCIPMGLATIVNGFLLFGAPMLGEMSVEIAFVLWWIDAVLAIVIGLAIPFMMFTRQDHAIDQMSAVWLLPIVAGEVAAVSGGLLLPQVADPTTQLNVLIASFVLWAFSVPLALGILVILFLRMIVHNLPHAGMAATSWLALGPIGTGALGLALFATNGGPVLTENGLDSLSSAMSGASALAALLLWGYGLWWLVTAIVITLRYVRDGLPFNIGWWGYTFPLGVYAVATHRLGSIFHVAFIDAFGDVLVAALVVIWIVVASRTVVGVLNASLLVDPSLDRRTSV